MRTLLGAAEAGFFPGIIFYLIGGFPGSHRGRVTGLLIGRWSEKHLMGAMILAAAGVAAAAFIDDPVLNWWPLLCGLWA